TASARKRSQTQRTTGGGIISAARFFCGRLAHSSRELALSNRAVPLAPLVAEAGTSERSQRCAGRGQSLTAPSTFDAESPPGQCEGLRAALDSQVSWPGGRRTSIRFRRGNAPARRAAAASGWASIRRFPG